MNFKWIVGKNTFTVLALFWSLIAIRELLSGDFLTAGLALLVAVHDIRDAQNGTEVKMFELNIRKGAK
jgi:phosphatidylserine synthase